MLDGIAKEVEEDSLQEPHVGFRFKGFRPVEEKGPGSSVKTAHPFLYGRRKVETG